MINFTINSSLRGYPMALVVECVPCDGPATGGGRLCTPQPPEWIEGLRPQVVLLSVSPGDRRGVPSPEALEAVQGYTLLRTDRNGWIELTTDGERKWVEVEKLSDQ